MHLEHKRSEQMKALLERAVKDLEYWLKVAGVQTQEEFFAKEEEIKKRSYHKHQDVIDHLSYISKIKAKVG